MESSLTLESLFLCTPPPGPGCYGMCQDRCPALWPSISDEKLKILKKIKYKPLSVSVLCIVSNFCPCCPLRPGDCGGRCSAGSRWAAQTLCAERTLQRSAVLLYLKEIVQHFGRSAHRHDRHNQCIFPLISGGLLFCDPMQSRDLRIHHAVALMSS